MPLIPFGAFQAMLGILFAMTLLATASGKSFQGSSTMLAILLPGLQRAEIVTWWADSFREGGGRRMRWTDCPSVSFDCPQRERGQVYISGREEKTKECGLLSGPLSADSPFGRLRHQTTIGREGE